MNISILIPYRDRKEHLMVLLTQIKRNLMFFKHPLETIIIDLGSKENISAEVAEFPFVSYHYIDYKETFCKSWGLNLAFKKARHDWIFVLDVDCIFFEKFLLNVGKLIDPENTGTFYSFGGVTGLNESVTKVIKKQGIITNRVKTLIEENYDKFEFLQGVGNLILHRGLYEKLSGYDEKMIGWGREDSDFYNRLPFAGAAETVIPDQPDQSLYHLHHGQSDLTYNNWWIFCQNDFVERYNKHHKIVGANGDEAWGDEAAPPDQYRYESLLDFTVEKGPGKTSVLAVNGTYLDNMFSPRDVNDLYDPPLVRIDLTAPVVLLGGGLNYACKVLLKWSKKKAQIFIVEKYKRIREAAIQHNGIEPSRFVSTDFMDMPESFTMLQQMNPKTVAMHRPSFVLDRQWYQELLNLLQPRRNAKKH